MKRKFLWSLFLIMLSGMLTGCIKVEQSIIIDRNGSAEMRVATLMDSRLKAYLPPDAEEQMMEEIKKESSDTKVEKVERGDYFGYEIVTESVNIEKSELNVSKSNNIKSYNKDNKFISVVENNLFKKTYNIDANFNLTSLDGMDSSRITPEMAKMFVYTFKITIPEKAVKSNAKSVDEKTHTYSWDIAFFQSNPVKLRWVVYNYTNITIVVILAILLVFGLIAKFRKKE